MIDLLYTKSLEVESLSHNVVSKLHSIIMLEKVAGTDLELAALELIRQATKEDLLDELNAKPLLR